MLYISCLRYHTKVTYIQCIRFPSCLCLAKCHLNSQFCSKNSCARKEKEKKKGQESEINDKCYKQVCCGMCDLYAKHTSELAYQMANSSAYVGKKLCHAMPCKIVPRFLDFMRRRRIYHILILCPVILNHAFATSSSLNSSQGFLFRKLLSSR